jgi:hypothetical protein
VFGSATVNDLIASKARERVVCHLTDGQSLRGVLVAAHKDCVVLAHVEALADHVATPVDGEALVPRARLSWLQVLPAEA